MAIQYLHGDYGLLGILQNMAGRASADVVRDQGKLDAQRMDMDTHMGYANMAAQLIPFVGAALGNLSASRQANEYVKAGQGQLAQYQQMADASRDPNFVGPPVDVRVMADRALQRAQGINQQFAQQAGLAPEYLPQQKHKINQIYNSAAMIESRQDLSDEEKAFALEQLASDMQRIRPRMMPRNPMPTVDSWMQQGLIKERPEHGGAYIYDPKSGTYKFNRFLPQKADDSGADMAKEQAKAAADYEKYLQNAMKGAASHAKAFADKAAPADETGAVSPEAWQRSYNDAFNDYINRTLPRDAAFDVMSRQVDAAERMSFNRPAPQPQGPPPIDPRTMQALDAWGEMMGAGRPPMQNQLAPQPRPQTVQQQAPQAPPPAQVQQAQAIQARVMQAESSIGEIVSARGDDPKQWSTEERTAVAGDARALLELEMSKPNPDPQRVKLLLSILKG